MSFISNVPGYLVICSFFNNSDYTASKDYMRVSNELQRIGKEAAVAWLEVPPRDFPGETEKILKPLVKIAEYETGR